MKKIERKGLSKTYLALIVLLSVLATLVAVYFIVTAVSNKDGDTDTATPPELWEGETTYLGQPVAYAPLQEKDFTYIRVINEKGSFELTRPDDKGAFWLTYRNSADEEYQLYSPPIVGAEGGFSYESLYAVEQNDGYGRIYMLTYLCSALGTPYFTERIPLPAGDTEEEKREREILLEEYGLDAAQAEYVAFVYNERNEAGKVIGENTHLVTIGDRALSGFGYYYMADERDCIYYTTANTFEYATKGFNAYIKGMLIAAGLEGDSSLEPYQTTDFKQWVLEEHLKEGEVVSAGSSVICHLDAFLRMDNAAEFEPSLILPDFIQYRQDDGSLVIDLDAIKKNAEYERLIKTLVGKTNGVYYNPTADGSSLNDRILITLLTAPEKTSAMDIDFGDGSSRVYAYSISSIDSVITADGETSVSGSSTANAQMLRVTYTYTVDGSEASSPRQAVLDLSAELLPAEAKEALLLSTVGKLDTSIDFEITYTKENAPFSSRKMVVSEIVAIFDENDKIIEKVTANSRVSIRYYTVIDGKKGETVRESFKLSTIGEDSVWYSLKQALIGQKTGSGLNLQIYNDIFYREILRDFTTLAIDRIYGFIESELVVSFQYVNSSAQDPYYGATYYKNTTEGKYGIYGLNQGACEAVVKALGGIENNSQASDGLMGETVAVGLTHENMKNNNNTLYAYKIYFELPRGIYDKDDGTETEGDSEYIDYAHHSTLGFTLYISEETITGQRYVGSDMYDLVALVDGSKLEFLKQSFPELYARKDLLLLDVKNLDSFEIEFNMEDVYGSWGFEVDYRTVYMGYENGELKTSLSYFEGATSSQKFYITASEGEGSMETELGKYLDEIGRDEVAMSALYNKVLGGGKELLSENKKELLGSSYFLEAFEEIQLSRYQGILTAEEQAAAKAGGAPIMKFRIHLDPETPNAKSCYYTYEFYRLDDRRIMVSLYEDNGSWQTTSVSDFYISAFSFKQIVANFVSLVNAEEFDGDIPYPDEVKQ